ncbi:hypothetical protein CNBD2090 [Cryptococcus deneoformans B-3501A]|uniref:hypothetical protein n=1 Tax=Cryptococcus deneoformans (strain B-3501A) TaxID=283643 RepID=UPI000042F35A|nr:hypothetical protein CNBD2090 [Cryptococcus neoformans var. neoformans B-3501A]EAL21515.1 hypothetical protein CNBD2090 [Cryptococcus neoformans var. neoformans B-3501A]
MAGLLRCPNFRGTVLRNVSPTIPRKSGSIYRLSTRQNQTCAPSDHRLLSTKKPPEGSRFENEATHLIYARPLASSSTPPIPISQVIQILQQTSCDLITLVQLVSDLEKGDLAYVQEALRYLLPCLGRRRMAVLLPRVLDIWMEKVDVELEEGRVEQAQLQTWYHQIVKMLSHFIITPGETTHQSHQDPLPGYIKKQVVRLISHLIDILPFFPSSSTQRPCINFSLLERLFTRRYLSTELRVVLAKHCVENGIELSARMWHECVMVSLSENDTKMVRKLEKRKQAALDKEAEAQETFRGKRRSQTKSKRRRRLRKIADLISRLQITNTDSSHEKLFHVLEPYLDPPSLESLPSLPANPSSPSDGKGLSHIPSSHLVQHACMPMKYTTGRTLTPIMHGLLRRGEGPRAWSIWRELVSKESKLEKRSEKGLFVDRVSLSVGAQICHGVAGLDNAIEMVDLWAHRPWQPPPVQGQMENSIFLDTQCVNILLTLCQIDGATSTAFRLWKAALPRWGVYVDHISLKILIDIARYHNVHDKSVQPDADVFKERLRQMVDGFSFWREGRGEEGAAVAYDAYEDAGFAKGSTSVLLAPSGNFNAHEKEDWRFEKPWQMARVIFRQVVLGNWPHLRETQSPLDEVDQSAFDKFTSLFDGDLHIPRHASGDKPRKLNQDSLPDPNARYTHIIPTASTFHSYISLLGYYNHPHEIPVALAWMKALSIVPTWFTMRLALMHICEAEGPRRWVRKWGKEGKGRLVRDEEIMRRWLEEWLLQEDSGGNGGLGDNRADIVPSEEEVAAFRRMFAERNQRVTA